MASKHSQRRFQKPKADGALGGAQVTRALPLKAFYLLYGKDARITRVLGTAMSVFPPFAEVVKHKHENRKSYT